MRCGPAFCATDKGIRRKRNHAIAWMHPGGLADGLDRLRRLTMLIPLLALGACSITSPIGGFGDDDDVATGSLKTGDQPSFVDSLTAEDWRRARAALAVALDPQGNGSPVRWDNPETKASGSFSASGAFFVKNHLVCRPFSAALSIKGVAASPHGVACRKGPGDWLVDEHGAAPAPQHAADPPSAARTRTTRGETPENLPKAPKAGALF